MRSLSERLAAHASRTVALCGFALACLLAPIAPGHAHSTRPDLFNETQALAYSQQAIGRLVADQSFIDSGGNSVQLAAFRGHPVVLSMLYTSCTDICPLIVEHLANAVDAADRALGPGRFTVLTVGFDTHADTPARLAAYRAAHRIQRPDWLFLSAGHAEVDRLAADTGFEFAPRAGGFDHLAQVTVLDEEGRVYRQVYGADFAAPALVEPLKQLTLGRRESPLSFTGLANRVRLLCTIYDPATGRYRFSYAIFVGLAVGAASLGAVAASIVRMWRVRRA
ncbi:MAG TPA: SCO family protein [Acetobacteraceae bacterium]|jgi:protein SCO1/2